MQAGVRLGAALPERQRALLDRREHVAHHPLAELTRSALRTVAHDWRHDDWFAALKAGFTPLPEPDLDRLDWSPIRQRAAAI